MEKSLLRSNLACLHKLSKTPEFNLSQKSIESGAIVVEVEGFIDLESGRVLETDSDCFLKSA